MVGRAGLTRSLLALTATGLAVAALARPPLVPSAVALTALLLAGTGSVATARRTSDRDATLAAVILTLVLAAFAAGLVVGAARLQVLMPRPVPASLEGRRVVVEGTVTGPVRVTGRGWEASYRISGSADADGVSTGMDGETVLLRLEGDDGPAMSQGALARAVGRLEAPQPGEPGEYDEAALLARRGIAVILRVKPDRLTVVGRRGGPDGAVDRVRTHAHEALGHGLTDPEAALLRGVVLGETGAIDDDLMEAFRRSGTAHILSVSGLHVASLSAAVLLAAGLAGLRRRSASFVAMALVVVFALVTGAGPSVVRASVMGGAAMLAWVAGRGRDPWQGFFAAACFVLVIDPSSFLSPGFQLSFAAVAGLFALAPPIERALTELMPRWLAATLAISAGASLATAPLSLLHFGQTSVVAVLANLFVVPITGPVMALGLAAIAAGLVMPAVAGAINVVSVLLLSWTATVARGFARAPVLTTEHLFTALSALVGAGLALPLVWRVAGRALPVGFGWAPVSRLRFRPPRTAPRRVVLVLLLLSLGAVAGMGTGQALRGAGEGLALARGRAGWPARGEVRVLDVGQGSAVLVRTGGGHAALLDGGPATADLPEQLRALGVRQLDVVVVSHPHADHFAGLLASGMPPIRLLVDNVQSGAAGSGRGEPPSALEPEAADPKQAEAVSYLAFRHGIARLGGRIALVEESLHLRLDEVTVDLVAPRGPFRMTDGARPWGPSVPSGDRLNEGSLVALVRSGGVAILIPGDAEAPVVERLGLEPVDVLVVAHHGSQGAVSARLLGALRPRAACISVGAPNPFGHPDPTTVACLQEAGVQLRRTDQSGALVIPLRAVPAPEGRGAP